MMMQEIRGEIVSLNDSRQKLKSRNAEFKGAYAFTDHIYLPPQSNLAQEFWRIRHYHKTAWNQKLVNLTHKKQKLPDTKPMKISYQEFDTVNESQAHLPKDYEEMCHFHRMGEEYLWERFHIFLESVEFLPPSLEIVSPKPLDEIKSFMVSLGVRSFFVHAVPELVMGYNAALLSDGSSPLPFSQ